MLHFFISQEEDLIGVNKRLNFLVIYKFGY